MLDSEVHQVKCAWYVLPSLPEKLDPPELTDGVMTTAEFLEFKPDLILLEGRPQTKQHRRDSRRLPWDVEQAFLREGGAIIFLGASGDFNDKAKNDGFSEYGFPLALSGSTDPGCKWGGSPAFLSPLTGGPIKIEGADIAGAILGSSASSGGVDLLEVERPFVLDDTSWNAEPLLWAPEGYDAKDPVWRYEGSLGRVRKPYYVAAYTHKGGPILLFTGDLFSDFTVRRANNADFFRKVLNTIQELQNRKRLMAVRRDTAPSTAERVERSEQGSDWDFFIAYSARDGNYAERLFGDLSKYGRVFLDRFCLQPGDIWIQRLRSEQDRARCTVLLITESTDKAWFTNSEYVHAIELARTGHHRIVPILVGQASKLPYGLEQVHALTHDGRSDFTSVARRIADALGQAASS
jgi:hypothetical protein